ncbi:MAG: hypothetical protein K0R39_4489 [Symbiobacteriaceae bacterium]|jgi:hypothetical protein|nr:hypothetical protein [Symbiobacteriaceae bacterium]
MNEVLSTAWSVARSGWRANWNRSFRFSRMKVAALFLALQVSFFLLVARRVPSGASYEDGLGGLLALVAVQMGWFGMMNGFVRGQAQLYQGILVPLFQMTPARPLAFILGRVIEAVPARAWNSLLWAWAYAGLVPGEGRWGALPVLALFGLAVSLTAYLAGLLLLAFWSRWSPTTFRNGTIFFGAVSLALVTWALIYLAGGGSLADLTAIMRTYRLTVYGAVLALTAVPGLLLLGALAVRPAAVEDLYRAGLYQVLELNETDVDRRVRSRWLPLRSHVLRAVLSREWLELARSRMTRVQLLNWAAGTVGVVFAGRAIAGRPAERLVQYVGVLALFAWFMSYGHWVVRVFEKERRTMLLYRLAGVPARRLLLAKFCSIFAPSAVLVGVSVAVGALAAGASAGEVLRVLAWTLGALAAGTVGGFGAAAATASEGEEQELGAAAPKREGDTAQAAGNNAWWALLRTFTLLLTAGLPIWLGAGQPGLPFHLPGAPLLAVAAALPALILGAGYWIMEKGWAVHGQ